MVKRHLWFAQLAPTRPPLGPHLMAGTECVLGTLVRQGATVGEAMTYAALLGRHIFGSAQQEAEERATRERYGLTTPEPLGEAVTAARALAAEGGHPLLARWMAAPEGPDLDGQFALGVEFLIDGIAARLPGGGGGGVDGGVTGYGAGAGSVPVSGRRRGRPPPGRAPRAPAGPPPAPLGYCTRGRGPRRPNSRRPRPLSSRKVTATSATAWLSALSRLSWNHRGSYMFGSGPRVPTFT